MSGRISKKALTRIIFIAFALCAAGLFTRTLLSFGAQMNDPMILPQEPPLGEINAGEGAQKERPPRLIEGYSAWLPEWNLVNALREANAQKSGLESVQIFGAFFDKKDAPFLPPRIVSWIDDEADAFKESFQQEVNGHMIPVHLSVINDIAEPSGAGVAFKDPELVSRLMQSQESRDAHKKVLLDLLAQGPFDGLDIDYERIKPGDWKAFLDFCAELHAELKEQGKALRVVIEPKKEYYTIPFPDGPEYVLMAYNLFGLHSGPGPKANPDFIKRLGTMTSKVMSFPPRFAVATGGFVWDTSKKQGEKDYVKSVSESDAQLLMQREGVDPERDKESKYLIFKYPKDAKYPKVVWFADGETLAFIAETAQKNGFRDFALWSFSGNRRNSLNAWKTQVTKGAQWK